MYIYIYIYIYIILKYIPIIYILVCDVYTRHGVIVISNRNRGHVIDYIHGKYNVIAIVIDYFTKVIEIMITYHDYMIFFPSFFITVTYIL